MQTIRDLAALRAACSAARADGGLALVPTMGALHDGHLALIREARRHARHVAVSIFVNPTQFGPGEDLDAYPRREAEDLALIAAEGASIAWLPDAAAMYPDGFATSIRVGGPSEGLCGAARPGHFDGVATVVAKLFNQIDPDVAVFGEKDYQQLAVIRRLVADLDFAIRIVGLATVREADGLARSSRNAYLSADDRARAAALPATLDACARRIVAGESVAEVLADGIAALRAAGFASVEYLELRDAASLAPVTTLAAPARLLVAARIGATRLIDNIAVS
jgi:pantoate--beta-alanine ligase